MTFDPRLVRLLLLTLLLPLAGCDLFGGDDGGDAPRAPAAVFVANQGNFSDGNGSITAYQPEAGEAETFATGLASIVQSVLVTDEAVYVAANTGGSVLALDPETGALLGAADGLTSPRYLAVDGDRLYVTNLYLPDGSFAGGTVDAIDRETMTPVASVPVGDNPEGIALAGGSIWVANHGFGSGSTLSRLSEVADGASVETVALDCDGPRTLLAAESGLWVVCTGRTIYDDEWNPVGTTDGAVLVLDARTGAVERRWDVADGLGAAGPGQDAHLGARWLHVAAPGGRVLRFDAVARRLDTTLELGAVSVGALAYDDVAERLYVGHVDGFTNNGMVTVHALDGTETGRFVAGIAPTFIALRP